MDGQTMMAAKDAYHQLHDEYEARGKRYHELTRPYFSTVGFRWDVVDKKQPGGNGTPIILFLMLAKKDQEFFSYGRKDDVTDFGLFGAATDADTNLIVRNRTNIEDFAIEGYSASSRGVRIVYPQPPAGVADSVSQDVKDAVQFGKVVICDPGSRLVPPEASSPLSLEDALFEALAPNVHIMTSWNDRADQHLGCLDDYPEGGAKSYLRSHGEPTKHNIFRMPPGEIWRREGAAEDQNFAVLAEVKRQVLVVATLPQSLNAGDLNGNPAPVIPTAIYSEVKLRAHGRGFYYPSEND